MSDITERRSQAVILFIILKHERTMDTYYILI